jgi:hypothetical protein
MILPAKNQISCELGDEHVILNLDTGIYYGLDAIGARVWDIIQEPKTVVEILDILLTEYEVEVDTCRNDLLALMQEMAAQKLIEVMDGAAL